MLKIIQFVESHDFVCCIFNSRAFILIPAWDSVNQLVTYNTVYASSLTEAKRVLGYQE